MESDRLWAAASRLADYVKSPSLRHIRDPQNIQKLAREILQAVDQAGSVWSKWTAAREDIVKAAANCWVPPEDLRAFLNSLPGPALTATDVAQRLRAIWEEPWTSYPKEELQAGCRALYDAEKAAGTEMRAIIGALEEFLEVEEERLRQEQNEAYQQFREQDRIRRQQRFLSGADCGWTPIDGSKELFCRRNGRAFRVGQAKDKRWKLYRIAAVDDAGELLGTYAGRREASKALEQIAYQAEILR